MKNKLIDILLIIVAIVLGVVSWILLPEVVAVQVGFDGEITNTLPKALAVVVPLGVSIVGSIVNLRAEEEKSKKWFAISIVGIAVMILTLIINL